MNIQKMMQEAQKMQAKVEKAQNELENKEFQHEINQSIKFKLNGKKEILSIDIDSELLEPDNKDILEDMLMLGLNDIMSKIDEESEAIMGAATGNMSIPGLF